jgi:pyruvate/2-oxoglutarate dehydrogenase complex dihydrolipoamide dehydrogenase (E3) component
LGCEFASLYSHLQSNIVLIEKNSRLLKFMDEQVSIAVEAHLKELGVEIILNADIERVSNGEVFVQLRQTNTKRTIVGSLVLVCTGRKSTYDYENLRKLGIAVDQDRSTIIIDEKTCRTSIPTIYACGGVVTYCWSWVCDERNRKM